VRGVFHGREGRDGGCGADHGVSWPFRRERCKTSAPFWQPFSNRLRPSELRSWWVTRRTAKVRRDQG